MKKMLVAHAIMNCPLIGFCAVVWMRVKTVTDE